MAIDSSSTEADTHRATPRVKPHHRPETRLIAVCAGTDAARAQSRSEAEKLLERVDWRRLELELSARRLLPLLGERILALAGPLAPAWFAATTGRAIERCSEQDAWLELISIELIDRLRAAGIASLALKGPMLGAAVYGKPGRRPSADIDLLVAREDLRGAAEAAGGLGYAAPRPGRHPEELPLLHLRLRPAASNLPLVELHWRVHWYESDFSRRLLFRSVDAGASGRRAARADELTSLLLFYARDGFVDLRLACDVAAWWDAFGAELPAAVLVEIIAEHPALERAVVAAVDVADRVVGVPRAELLAGHPRSERRVRIASRLANPDGHGSEQQRAADTWLVDWLLTPRSGRLECIRRQLAAAPGVDHRLAGRRQGLRAALDRSIRLLGRYALALLRLGVHSSVSSPVRAAGAPRARTTG